MRIHIATTSYVQGAVTRQPYSPNRCLMYLGEFEDVPSIGDLFMIGHQVAVSGADELRRDEETICLLYEKEDESAYVSVPQLLFKVLLIIKVYGHQEGSVRIFCDYTLAKDHAELQRNV